ncbi:hypothetical protein [Actinoallomurus sp. CA-142502]|uniref:hypothetical protein n=1 Tax=Actinoallomurus sp. CA-142502 TaxID=3239885 RepID=UPI003D943F1E
MSDDGWKTNMDGWTEWTDYVGDLNLNAIFEMGNEWIRMGDALYAGQLTLADLVASLGWRGGAYSVAQEAWHSRMSAVLNNNADTAWKIGEAINAYGKSIYDQAQQMAEENNKAYLINIFSFVLGVVTAPLTLGIGALLSLLGRIIGNLVNVIAQVGARLGALGAVVSDFTAGAVTGAVASFGIDMAANGLASAATHTPVTVDWGQEGFNIGLGAAIGGGLGAGLGAAARGGRFGGVGAGEGARTPTVPDTPVVGKGNPTPGAAKATAGSGGEVPPAVKPAQTSFNGSGKSADSASGANGLNTRAGDGVVSSTSTKTPSGNGVRSSNEPPPATSSSTPAPLRTPPVNERPTGPGGADGTAQGTPPARSASHESNAGSANTPASEGVSKGQTSPAPGGEHRTSSDSVSPARRAGEAAIKRDADSKAVRPSDQDASSSGDALGKSVVGGGRRDGSVSDDGRPAGGEAGRQDGVRSDSAARRAGEAAVKRDAASKEARGQETSSSGDALGKSAVAGGRRDGSVSDDGRPAGGEAGRQDGVRSDSAARRAGEAAVKRDAASKEARGQETSSSGDAQGKSAAGGGRRDGTASNPAARGEAPSPTRKAAYGASSRPGTGKSPVPTTRQLLRRDTVTGESQLVDVGTGRRLGEPPAGDPPRSARTSDDVSTGAGTADRYRYYEVDPKSGAARETSLGPNDHVVNIRPASGKVTEDSGLYVLKDGRMVPAGDAKERLAVFDQGDGKWDVANIPAEPAGGAGRVVGGAKPTVAPPRQGAGSYQVLRRDGTGNIDLLTFPRRPGDVPPRGGTEGDGSQYHELDGGRDGWHEAHPFGAGAAKVERIITAPRDWVSGKPMEGSGPPAVLVRDQRTGLYEQITSIASGGRPGDPVGRVYYRIGSDGRPQPVKFSDGVDVVSVSRKDGAVTRTTSSVSGGNGAATPYLAKDGTLTSGSGKIFTGELRFDADTGRITRVQEDPAGSNGRPGDGSGGPGGGGRGTATRSQPGGSRTRTQTGAETFTDVGTTSRGAATSRSSEGRSESGSAAEKDSFAGEGRRVGPSSEHPDSQARAEAFDRIFGRGNTEASSGSRAGRSNTAPSQAGEHAETAGGRVGESEVQAPTTGQPEQPRPPVTSASAKSEGTATPQRASAAKSAADARPGNGSGREPEPSQPGADSRPESQGESSGYPQPAAESERGSGPRSGADRPSSAGDEPTLLPPGQEALVVAGRVLPTDTVIVIDGESRHMTPADFVDWVRNQQGHEPDMPVVLLAGDARRFAPEVAALLGAPVTAPWADFVPSPAGDLIAGRVDRTPDGAVQLISEDYDGWHTYGPDGQDTELGPVLPDSASLLNSVVAGMVKTGRPVATWRSPAGPTIVSDARSGELPSAAPSIGSATVHAAPRAADSPYDTVDVAAEDDAAPTASRASDRPGVHAAPPAPSAGAETTGSSSGIVRPAPGGHASTSSAPTAGAGTSRSFVSRRWKKLKDKLRKPAPAGEPASVREPVQYAAPPSTSTQAPERSSKGQAAELRNMSPAARFAKLASLPLEEKRTRARSPEFLRELRGLLAREDFAAVVAQLMVEVPSTTERPATAHLIAHVTLTRVLRSNAEVAEALARRVRVVVIPRGQEITSLPEFADRAGTMFEGATPYERVRSVLRKDTGILAVGEEHLTGEAGLISGDRDTGYSTLTHELARGIWEYAFNGEKMPTPANKETIRRRFETKKTRVAEQWPGGPPTNPELPGSVNASAAGAEEYFAELTNVWLGLNHGRDVSTGLPRNNTTKWVEKREPYDVLQILAHIYGMEGELEEDSPVLEDIYGAAARFTKENPLRSNYSEDELYRAFREFMGEPAEERPSFSPQVDVPVVVGQFQSGPRRRPGGRDSATGTIFFAGYPRDPEQTARWINRNYRLEETDRWIARDGASASPRPVMVMTPGVETRRPDGGPAYFRTLAAHLRRPVVVVNPYTGAQTKYRPAGSPPEDEAITTTGGGTTTGTPSAAGEAATRKPESPKNRAAALEKMTPAGRFAELASLSLRERRALARDPEFSLTLSRAIPPEEFAAVAAQLMIEVPPAVHRPVTAHRAAHSILTRMLRYNPVVAQKLAAGRQVVIIPRDRTLRSLPQFSDLPERSAYGRPFDSVRGLHRPDKGVLGVSEESLTGELGLVSGNYDTGYAVLSHEVAHAILSETSLYVDPEGITARARIGVEESFEAKKARGGQWPNGPLTNPYRSGRQNYSSRDYHEYFAELTNTWLGVNYGLDSETGLPANNGGDWVKKHEPAMVSFLEDVYGPAGGFQRPSPVLEDIYGSAGGDEKPYPVRPLYAEDESYRALREFMGEPAEEPPPFPHLTDVPVVIGEFRRGPEAGRGGRRRSTGRIFFAGYARNAEETARWITRNYQPEETDRWSVSKTPRPVMLVAPGAEKAGDTAPPFAYDLATHLGRPVVVVDPSTGAQRNFSPPDETDDPFGLAALEPENQPRRRSNFMPSLAAPPPRDWRADWYARPSAPTSDEPHAKGPGLGHAAAGVAGAAGDVASSPDPAGESSMSLRGGGSDRDHSALRGWTRGTVRFRGLGWAHNPRPAAVRGWRRLVAGSPRLDSGAAEGGAARGHGRAPAEDADTGSSGSAQHPPPADGGGVPRPAASRPADEGDAPTSSRKASGGKRVRWADLEDDGTREAPASQAGGQEETGPVPGGVFDEAVPSAKVEDVIGAATMYATAEGRPVVLSLPGAAEDGPRLDDQTVELLAKVAPPQTVFVTGRVREGALTVGDAPVDPAVLATLIAARAPGHQPFLLMPGSGRIAGSLAIETGGPVPVAPHGVLIDVGKGTVTAAVSGKAPAGRPAQAGFEVYVPAEGAEGSDPSSAYVMRPMNRATLSVPADAPPATGTTSSGRTDTKPAASNAGTDVPATDAGTWEPQPPASPSPAGTTPMTVDRAALSALLPRLGLPYMGQLIAAIRQEAAAQGVTLPEDPMRILVKRLVSNYPYALGDSGNDANTSGLLVPLGEAEVLVTFDPTDPHTLDNPAGATDGRPATLPAPDGEYVGNETINATYATGAHVQTTSGQTEQTRASIKLGFGIGAGVGPLNIVRAGVSISGTANQSKRSLSHIEDAEGGHVEDYRGASTLLAFRPNISFKLRTDREDRKAPGWERIKPVRIADPGTEKLMLWTPEPYLKEPSANPVTATGEGVDTEALPPHFYASGLTNLPKLFDEIIDTLASQGLNLKIGDVTRDELLQKLWNLNTHLDKAVNAKRGYRFTLHDEYGDPRAAVQIHAGRLPAGARPVGAPSDKAHVEVPRTAIDGTSGGHTVAHSSTVTPLLVDVGFAPPNVPGLSLTASLSLGYTSSNEDSISAGKTGLWVMVPRYTGHTAAYSVEFVLQAKVMVRRPAKTKDPRPATNPVWSRGLVRLTEPDAFKHGFPIDRDALKPRQRPTGGTVPYDPDALTLGPRVKDTETKKGTETGKDAEAREAAPPVKLPEYLFEGKGIGFGTVKPDESTIDEIKEMIASAVRPMGFLPEDEVDPFAGEHWYTHGNKIISRLDNEELLDKMVSVWGFASHHDGMLQDGMRFTLKKRRGTADIDLDVDSVEVEIKATQRKDRPPKYLGTTDEYHLVNLPMGMDIVGTSTSHSRKLAGGVAFKALYLFLQNALSGIEAQRSIGATDSVTFINNQPDLLEHPGEALEVELINDYQVTLRFQHSGQTGKINKGGRDQVLPTLEGQRAIAHLLPIDLAEQPSPDQMSVPERLKAEKWTPADVLDQGVVFHADATGLTAAAGSMLADLVGPAGTANQNVNAFAGLTNVRAHLKEILNHEYTTDELFDTGFFRNTLAALDIAGDLGPSRFVGATSDNFVLGIIKLLLLESRLSASGSKGLAWDQLNTAFGGNLTDTVALVGGTDVNRRWQWNRSRAGARVGGKEYIQVDVKRVFLYRAPANFTVSGRLEKHAKLLPSSHTEHRPRQVNDRTLLYVLTEPEALKWYANGTLPVSDAELTKSLTRWHDGDLRLTGDVVAGVLTRWHTDLTARPKPRTADLDLVIRLGFDLARMHGKGGLRVMDPATREGFSTAFGRPLADPPGTGRQVDMPPDLVEYAAGGGTLPHERLTEAMSAWQSGALDLTGDVAAGVLHRWVTEVPKPPDDLPPVDRAAMATTLAGRHTQDVSPVRDEAVRAAFEAAFGKHLPEPPLPFEELRLPEYLMGKSPLTGHSGLHTWRHRNGKSTYRIVREQVDKAAPGLLSAGAEVWDREGRVIGRLQGGVDALQGLLAKRRDQAMLDELFGEDGLSLYLVHPHGWLLTDVVEVNLRVALGEPEVRDFAPGNGNEVYLHGYQSMATSTSRDVAQGATLVQLSAGGRQTTTGGGSGALKTSASNHRGVTRAETSVAEQTAYGSDHYILGFDTELTAQVRRLGMPHRPLNNLLDKSFDGWTRHSATSTVTVDGTLELQLPRTLAESGAADTVHPRPDLTPLPELPGNAFVTGVVFDDTVRIGRDLLARVFPPSVIGRLFGARAGDPDTRSSLSLPVLLSRMHLAGHLREATGGNTYKMSDDIFDPGDDGKRATMWLKGGLSGLEVLAPLKKGTGIGRYGKHQSGTTVSASTDHTRGTVDAAVNVHGPIGEHQPGHSWQPETGNGRTTSFNDGSAGTENSREEGHGKERGPLYLVRMRFHGHLIADLFRRPLFGTAKPKGRFYSDPINGHVYAKLYQSQIDGIRAEIAETNVATRPKQESWPAMDKAPSFDLVPLLARAAQEQREARRAYQGVARHIRRQLGADRPVVLTVDEKALAARAYQSVLDWGLRIMRADLTAAREIDPTVRTPAALVRYELLPPAPGGSAENIRAATSEIIEAVNGVHALRPDDRDGGPAALPPLAAISQLDPADLGRDVAHALGAHVRVDVTVSDGTVRRTWSSPSGRTYFYDPATARWDPGTRGGALWVFDRTGSRSRVFTSAMAEQQGLVSPELRGDLDRYGLDYQEMGRLYLSAQARQQTLEQAVRAELGDRARRLAEQHPALPELLRRAAAVRTHWRNEENRLNRQRVPLMNISADDASLSEWIRLHEAEENAEAVGRLLADLRATARGGPGAPAWTAQAVRSAAVGLDRFDGLGLPERLDEPPPSIRTPSPSDAPPARVADAEQPEPETSSSAPAGLSVSLPSVSAAPPVVGDARGGGAAAPSAAGSTGRADDTDDARPPADRVRASDRPVAAGAGTTGRPASPDPRLAAVVAQRMIEVPPAVERPASTRHVLHEVITRMLTYNPDLAGKVLNAGATAVIIPRGAALTSLPRFRRYEGRNTADGRPWQQVRGQHEGVVVAIGEENLLGESGPGGTTYSNGYSSATHEIAHFLYEFLDAEAKKLIRRRFEKKFQAGTAAQWPDGPRTNPKRPGSRNYSSLDEREYWAQLTNVYMGTNAGLDPATGLPRNNTFQWILDHEKPMLDLLERTYGPPGLVQDANPVRRARAEQSSHQGYRTFMTNLGSLEPAARTARTGGDRRPSATAPPAGGEPTPASPPDEAPVVVGAFDPATRTISIARRPHERDSAAHAYDAEQTARWITRHYTLTDGPVMVMPARKDPGPVTAGPGMPGPAGEPSFADDLATRLGVPVMVVDPFTGAQTEHRPGAEAATVPEQATAQASAVEAPAPPSGPAFPAPPHVPAAGRPAPPSDGIKPSRLVATSRPGTSSRSTSYGRMSPDQVLDTAPGADSGQMPGPAEAMARPPAGAGSGWEDVVEVGGGRPTVPQATALERMALRLVPVLAAGDDVVHAMQAVAPAETSVAARGRPASPAELRAYLADALAADLDRDPGRRRFWPTLRLPGDATDGRGRAIVAALISPDGTAEADELFLGAAAAVLGLRVTALRPDGGTVEFGPPAGRSVVLVRLPEPGPYTGRWAGTEPIADGGSPAGTSGHPAPPTGDDGRAVPPSARNAPSAEATARTPVANLGADPFQGNAGDGTDGMKRREPTHDAGHAGHAGEGTSGAAGRVARSGGEASSIAGEFGVQVDSGAAVTAVREKNPRADAGALSKVRERRWSPEELSAVRAALEHYAPILGMRRERSNRAGIDQEVSWIGAVSFGITRRGIDYGMAGEYIDSHKTVTMYAPILLAKDLGGGRREIEGTVTHELAHGLLKYALPEFTEAFGSWGADGRPKLPEGVEPPITAETAAADLEASIRSSFLTPERLAARSPKHAAAVATLKQRYPELFELKPDEYRWTAATRIAAELNAQLPEFARMAGSWTEDGWPKFSGERPITRYGATNAREDIAETAKYYFLEPETLRAKAPERAAFFDRLIAEWGVPTPEPSLTADGTEYAAMPREAMDGPPPTTAGDDARPE